MSSDISSRAQKFSFANPSQVQFLEDLLAKYRSDPDSVDASWQKFFEGMDFASQSGLISDGGSSSENEGRSSALVEAYINAYRKLGHLSADLNPLQEKPSVRSDMTPEAHGLKNVADSAASSQKFFPVNLPSKDGMTFAEIDQLLKDTYCRRIGAEFRDSDSIEFVKWLQDLMETSRNKPQLTPKQKLEILNNLVQTEGFESFLQARYLGQKRFSIEGLDAFIPFLHTLTNEASTLGVEEICLGMAHRGRLNVLTNYMGKSYEHMLKEFEGLDFNPLSIDGDVKYHKGYANEISLENGKKTRLFLAPNPSHLEAVAPVVEGFVAARQRAHKEAGEDKVLPIIIHGDASVAGQGIVAETINLSLIKGYRTGGSIHVILNNQVGFTTDPEEDRSCTYASGIAKFINAPILHVNADDPEAVVWSAKLAIMYRQKFKKDIFIDIIGYRRYGHNETDEPNFTQPVMYKKIAQHPTVLTLYAQKLIQENVITERVVNEQKAKFRERMQSAFDSVKSGVSLPSFKAPAAFKEIYNHKEPSLDDLKKPTKTALSFKNLENLAKKILNIPKDFKAHPKVLKLIDTRAKMLEKGAAIDWAFAELLAFASLSSEGHAIRLSGQDCQRGTFSSRHAVIRDNETGKSLSLLNQIDSSQGYVEILNSPLSEQGVMGFDFGFSVADPNALVCWEGQFGDFVNGAQIIIDQFLAASEQKWKQCSGLTLILPHGYEGMGPEHSSARPERFLQLCGNLNIQVATPSTAAQYFHILRRQLHRGFIKPLIIMSPKSLLRHAGVASKHSEFTDEVFREVLDDARIDEAKSVRKVIFCTGKIYYELLETLTGKEKTADAEKIALVRVEQLYPFPDHMLKDILKKYSKAAEVLWVQEEPQNMGAWTFVRPRLDELLTNNHVKYVGRRDSGTTAEGSSKAHAVEQSRIIKEALS